MRVLTFSSLFPNPAQPNLGLFVAERLRQWLKTYPIDVRIVAPAPWFPSRNPRFGKYAEFAGVPARSMWEGREVLHPKYVVVPGPGWYFTPLSMALSARGAVARILESFDFDVIDAHYYYPDGVAAAMLARWFKRPLTITARGTDVNLIPSYRMARKMVTWAAERAAASITVSQALKDAMTAFGADGGKISVLRNGVDLQRFKPLDRERIRSELDIRGKTLLSAGYLIERKGHHLVIDAMRDLPDWDLLIAGDGELREALGKQVRECGVENRVRFVGALPQAELIRYYNAADVLVLASSREGMPNVVLEALACGTPVVATNLWGTPEVVNTPAAGKLMRDRSATAIVEAVRELERSMPARAAVRAHAELFGWDVTSRGLHSLFEKVLHGVAR